MRHFTINRRALAKERRSRSAARALERHRASVRHPGLCRGAKCPVRDGSAEAKRAQARLDAAALRPRQHFDGHLERSQGHKRRQVSVQPEDVARLSKAEKRADKPTRAAARSRQQRPPTGVPPPATRDPQPRPRLPGGPRLTSATRTAQPAWPHQTPSKGLEQQHPPT